jgi:hypothetical protein
LKLNAQRDPQVEIPAAQMGKAFRQVRKARHALPDHNKYKALTIQLAQTKDSIGHRDAGPDSAHALSRQAYKQQIAKHGMVWYGIP